MLPSYLSFINKLMPVSLIEFTLASTWLFVSMLESRLSHGFSESCLIPRLNLDNSSSNFKTLTLISSPNLKFPTES